MSDREAPARFRPLVPGSPLVGDWFAGRIPDNISVGVNCVIDSSFCFKHFYSTLPTGLVLGDNVTLWRTSIATAESAVIHIGEDSYVANASLVCSSRIEIGARVMISGGVTIADSDFHPLEPAARLADTIALSPRGDRRHRPEVATKPVTIEDDVWIGWNATILKGVRVGARAVIEPGAVVTKDVAADATVSGNPAREVSAG